MNPDYAAHRLLRREVLHELNAWRELAAIALILMQLSWLLPWFEIFSASAATLAPIPFYFFGLLSLSAYGISRLMDLYALRLRVRRILSFFLILLSVIAGLVVLAPERALADEAGATAAGSWQYPLSLPDLPGLISVSLFILLVWRHALRLAEGGIGPIRVRQSFQIAFLLVVAATFLEDLIFRTVGPAYLYLFLSSGLIAMATARLATLETTHGRRNRAFSVGLFLVMVLAVLVLLILSSGGATFAVWVGPIVVELLFRVLVVLTFLLVAPLVLLAFVALSWVMDRIHLDDLALFETLNRTLSSLRDLFQSLSVELSGINRVFVLIANFWGRWGGLIRTASLFLLLLGAVVYVVSRIRGSARAADFRKDDDAEFESLSGNLLELLRAMLSRQIQGIAHGLNQHFRARNHSRHFVSERIRQIYAELMVLCAEMKNPRPAAITPLEFLRTLDRVFPGFGEEVRVITRAYVRVRYGEEVETTPEIQEVEQAWAHLKTAGARKL